MKIIKIPKINWRHFFIGLVTGIFIWFITDLIFDWDDNVRDYWRGYDAATNRIESRR